MSTSDATKIRTSTYYQTQKTFTHRHQGEKEKEKEEESEEGGVRGIGGRGGSIQFVFCFGILLLCWSGPHQDLSRALISSSKMKTCFPFEWTDPGY